MKYINLKKFRIKTGLSLTQAAKALGTTPSAVCMWETGVNTPKTSMLPKISALYGCSVDELLLDCAEVPEGLFIIEDYETQHLETEGFRGLAALAEIFAKWNICKEDSIVVTVYRNESGDGHKK